MKKGPTKGTLASVVPLSTLSLDQLELIMLRLRYDQLADRAAYLSLQLEDTMVHLARMNKLLDQRSVKFRSSKRKRKKPGRATTVQPGVMSGTVISLSDSLRKKLKQRQKDSPTL